MDPTLRLAVIITLTRATCGDGSADPKGVTVVKAREVPGLDARPRSDRARSHRIVARTEHAGDLRIGLSATRVRELLPSIEVYNEHVWEHETGVRIEMVSRPGAAGPVVDRIIVSAPSTLRSALGVGVGDGVDAVRLAYGEGMPATSNDDGFLDYGGIAFTIVDGKVASIRIGEPGAAD